MSKVQKIKQHFKDHKVTYIACGVTAVVVAGVTYYLVGKPDIQAGVRVNQILPWKTTTTITNTIELTAPTPRGAYGHLIECVTTGEWFASQKRAAEVLGIDRGLLRKHLQGKLKSVSGLEFRDYGEYMPAVDAAKAMIA